MKHGFARLGQLLLFASLAAGSFAVAYFARTWQSGGAARTQSAPPSNAPDSVRLSAMGIKPGRQLIVYVLLSSRCGHCQRLDTKAAVRTLRDHIHQNNTSAFKSATMVGVAVDGDLGEGLDYINSIGLRKFDEISIGNTWLNEHLVRLVWRERFAKPAVPQVLVVARQMSAALSPFNINYGRDSVIALLTGRTELLEWAREGATAIGAAHIAGSRLKRDHTIAGELNSTPAK